MVTIEQFIKENIEGITDEQRQSIVDAVNENYRTKPEVEKKAERIATLEKELASRDEKIAALEGDSAEIADLRKQVEEFQAASAAAAKVAAEAAEKAAFDKRFDTAVEKLGRKFASSFTRDGVLSKVREACAADATLEVSDAIEAATKDAYGVWENPQEPVHKMPGTVDTSAGSEEAVKKAFAKSLFGA